MKHRNALVMFFSLIVLGFVGRADAQQALAQQAAAIFEQHCVSCHGENRVFAEILTIEHAALLASGTVIPRDPGASAFYRRLLPNLPAHQRMPLGREPLTPEAIETVRRWIEAGAPNWEVTPTQRAFITPDAMLSAIRNHVDSLTPFERPFARYFSITHLYNAGETAEALRAYRRALSKLINSLSWGYEIIRPQSIDVAETLFYIDLRHYEWDVTEAWNKMEASYPYAFDYGSETYETLRQEMNCEVPFLQADWFLAAASLPPLYYDILNLPGTDGELEQQLDVNIARNIQSAPGVRVWRAGFNESRVSRNNRVVERHTSRYGAYWKSYDFAGNVERKNIFTHPLSFTHDGSEIIFNLPNGLQAYYLSNAAGLRLDGAPVDIVSNPAARNPVVRNGLSCIGCHTEGMKPFEDGVREVIQQKANPTYDKAQALRLYVEKKTMDALLQADKQRFKVALEAAGGTFGGIEPVERFHQQFEEPLAAAHAAAGLGLTTAAFRQEIQNGKLQTFGLEALLLASGRVQRDTWTSQFHDIVSAFSSEAVVVPPVVVTPVVTPPVVVPPVVTTPRGDVVSIPDPGLRAVIEKALRKAEGATITPGEMAKLTELHANNKGIRDLTGLDFAVGLQNLYLEANQIVDLSPLTGLLKLNELRLTGNQISDLSPLADLRKLTSLYLDRNAISDVSPLAGLVLLKRLRLRHNLISDFSPLASLPRVIPLTYDNPGFPANGPKIEGPWLWVMLPGHPRESEKDLLLLASGGSVTEQDVATNGAKPGDTVGDSVWTVRKISSSGSKNINEMLKPPSGGRVVYGSVFLDSPRTQHPKMLVGANDGAKVWLNGELVHYDIQDGPGVDYRLFFPVTLKQGRNVLLVAVYFGSGSWNGFFGFEQGTEYTVVTPGVGLAFSVSDTRVAIGETFTLYLNAENVTDFAGWQFDLGFNAARLRADKVTEGNFLKKDGGTTFFQSGTIDNEGAKITGLSAARFQEKGVSGTGRLLSVTFTAKAPGKARFSISNLQFGASDGEVIPTSAPTAVSIQVMAPAWDVNGDGITNAADLRLVIEAVGESPPENPRTDVNGDGTVDADDVALVAEHLGEGAAAAPSKGHRADQAKENALALRTLALPEILTLETVEQALDILRAADDGSAAFRRGIANLERFLASLVPEKTALLTNYPNPFNPETWIPYQLAKPADVTVSIYAANGTLVRQLALGHQPAGVYRIRSRAAYWDGRNELGERVASGMYFYTLTADDFSTTGKMLMRK